MSKKMQDEIDKEVNRFMPTDMTEIRIIGHHDLRQLIRKTITSGTVLGWSHGETFQRERMQRRIDQLDYEIKCLTDRIKDAEMELLAVQK